jgi:hypothetical protein
VLTAVALKAKCRDLVLAWSGPIFADADAEAKKKRMREREHRCAHVLQLCAHSTGSIACSTCTAAPGLQWHAHKVQSPAHKQCGVSTRQSCSVACVGRLVGSAWLSYVRSCMCRVMVCCAVLPCDVLRCAVLACGVWNGVLSCAVLLLQAAHGP